MSADSGIHWPTGAALKRLMAESASQLLICAMMRLSTASIAAALPGGASTMRADQLVPMVGPPRSLILPVRTPGPNMSGERLGGIAMRIGRAVSPAPPPSWHRWRGPGAGDRKGVGWGKSGSGRVDLGGRRYIQKK